LISYYYLVVSIACSISGSITVKIILLLVRIKLESMYQVVISPASFGKYDKACFNLLTQRGYEVILNPYGCDLSGFQLIKLASYACGLIVGGDRIFQDILDHLPYLKVISCYGPNNIDIDATHRLGIKVVNHYLGEHVSIGDIKREEVIDIGRRSVKALIDSLVFFGL
jgi:D-3-phosphoglycerate dehydrogenase